MIKQDRNVTAPDVWQTFERRGRKRLKRQGKETAAMEMTK